MLDLQSGHYAILSLQPELKGSRISVGLLTQTAFGGAVETAESLVIFGLLFVILDFVATL